MTAADMANDPGLAEVADSIIAALTSESFHVFPDAMAKQFGRVYESFAKTMIGAEMTEVSFSSHRAATTHPLAPSPAFRR